MKKGNGMTKAFVVLIVVTVLLLGAFFWAARRSDVTMQDKYSGPEVYITVTAPVDLPAPAPAPTAVRRPRPTMVQRAVHSAARAAIVVPPCQGQWDPEHGTNFGRCVWTASTEVQSPGDAGGPGAGGAAGCP